MNAFFHAIAFLTRLPVPRLTSRVEDWQKSVGYYPAVGAILGILLTACALFFHWLFPPVIAAVLTIASWVFLTGGLHLDGWMDVADGLGSNRPVERMLEIMKDSRVGAMGVIAAILLLMIKTAGVYELLIEPVWLLLPPLLARLMLVIAIWFFPYLSSERGLGSGLRNGLSRVRVYSGIFATFAVAAIMFQLKGLFVFLGATVAACSFAAYLRKRLGGLTGDCYGAIAEWTEAWVLLLILLSDRFW